MLTLSWYALPFSPNDSIFVPTSAWGKAHVALDHIADALAWLREDPSFGSFYIPVNIGELAPGPRSQVGPTAERYGYYMHRIY